MWATRPRRATRETENALELRTRDRYRKLINKIDSTLRRLDEGDYGYCVDTGEPIGLDRLEARPTAERTLDAQERWEHLQKQMGIDRALTRRAPGQRALAFAGLSRKRQGSRGPSAPTRSNRRSRR